MFTTFSSNKNAENRKNRFVKDPVYHGGSTTVTKEIGFHALWKPEKFNFQDHLLFQTIPLESWISRYLREHFLEYQPVNRNEEVGIFKW